MSIFDEYLRSLEYLRISVTDRCNFRCTYCMPAHIFGQDYSFITSDKLLSFEEIIRVANILSQLGVKKIRLTGGEPLVRKNIEDLIAMLVEIDGIEEVTLTTNGFLLPQKAKSLKQAGLSRMNISLDSLDPDTFHKMNGGRAYQENVLAGIQAAEDAGFSPLKINTVVQRGVNEHDLVDLALYFRQRGHIVRFIEFMDAGTANGWNYDQVVTADEMIAILSRHAQLEPILPNYAGEVVRRYKYTDGGEVGFITSVSRPFCGGCSRLRLTAGGKLYTCLFATNGHDLRDLLRGESSNEILENVIRSIWENRTDRYSEDRSNDVPVHSDKVEMFHIGG